MAEPIQSFRIPEVLADYPWQRQFNPRYEEVKKESDGWMYSFKAFSAKSQYAFDKGRSVALIDKPSSRDMLTLRSQALCCALTYPTAKKGMYSVL
jgi:hypothetical protein